MTLSDIKLGDSYKFPFSNQQMTLVFIGIKFLVFEGQDGAIRTLKRESK